MNAFGLFFFTTAALVALLACIERSSRKSAPDAEETDASACGSEAKVIFYRPHKTGECWLFIYADGEEDKVAVQCELYAQRPELGFTWKDAAIVTGRLFPAVNDQVSAPAEKRNP